MLEPQEQVIRERAYALWEQEGRPEGRSLAHWFKAEAELAIERALVAQEKNRSREIATTPKRDKVSSLNERRLR